MVAVNSCSALFKLCGLLLRTECLLCHTNVVSFVAVFQMSGFNCLHSHYIYIIIHVFVILFLLSGKFKNSWKSVCKTLAISSRQAKYVNYSFVINFQIY